MAEYDTDNQNLDGSSNNWLERMHSFISWKVTFPECNNPFGAPMSDKVLIEFATKSEALLKYAELKGTVDGEEIILLKNITKEVEIKSNHPAVVTMKKSDVKNYLKKVELQKLVEAQVPAAQKMYQEEIQRRKIKQP
jgi:hypothetical protein